MYRLLNRTFKVTDLNTLETKTYEGMRECSEKTGLSYYKLNKLCGDFTKTYDFLTTPKGKVFRVEVTSDTKIIIEAIPLVPEMFSNIKFKSVTKLCQQFGIGKNTVYRKWKKAYPVYEENPTELIVKYYQNNKDDSVICKSGNAYGEKFILRFYKEYPNDKEAFEKHKGYKGGKNNE